MKYIKLFEEFVAELDGGMLNEKVDIHPKHLNDFFSGIARAFNARNVEVNKIKSGYAIDFDDKLRLISKRGKIVGYNLDFSDKPLELNKRIKTLEDIERNPRLLSGRDAALKGAPAIELQIPSIDARGRQQWFDEKRKLHRYDGGPAFVYPGVTKQWYQHGRLHRTDGPAEIWEPGKDMYKERWFKNGKVHRDGDEPAVTYQSGTQEWVKNNKWHREGDKPAVIDSDGEMTWAVDDKRHRETGPARIKADGTEEYWLDDKKVTKEQWEKRTGRK